MITKPLTDFLASVFSLPVLDYIDEKTPACAISFQVQSGINTRYEGGFLTCDFAANILYTSPKPCESIGFLTVFLADIDKRSNGVAVSPLDCAEIIEYETDSKIITSKLIHCVVKIEKNLVREQIKEVLIDG